MKSSSFDQLHTAVSAWVTLDKAQWKALANTFATCHAQPREHIGLPGDTKHDLIFVSDGLLRFYYLSPDGKESNKAFVAENEFAGPLASAMLGLPLYYGIEALEETTMLVAPLADFTALYHQHAVFERLGRKLAELLLVRKELRTRSLLEQTAYQRYEAFLNEHPTLVQRIPQYHLASYLGITEVSLSRLKNANR